jgi:uncharacterized protein YcsI (UPF0317 family)
MPTCTLSTALSIGGNTMSEVASVPLTAREVRLLARTGKLDGTTGGLAMGSMQANLVILPKSAAWDFLLFCQRNPRPCPVLEVLDCGSWEPRETAPGADLRTDLPRYRVFEHGSLVDEPTDIRRWWRDDLVSFLLGCSFSFEQAMQRAGLPLRHLEEKKTVSMYRTSIPCKPAGQFEGPLVVSMRPLAPMQAIKAAEITSRYPLAHGAPVHVGNPAAIGIRALDQPDYGEAVSIHGDELPVFWACAVTPQAAIGRAKPPLAITHAPGRMFITDLLADAGVREGP